MKLRVVATLVACLIPWFYADTSAAQIVEAALDDGETLLPEAGRIIAQGTGYQLIETDPSLTDGDSVTDESDEIVRMPPGPRRVWVFNSWQGVQNAPIPAELKADMAEEYTNVPFDAEDEGGEWLMDEAAALEAMAAVEETPPPTTRPGNPSEPRQLPFGLCSKKKKPGSKNKTINLSPSIIEREVAGGKIRANLNQSGQISATVFFTKKSRCGIPYSVKVDRVEITGVLDLPGSEIGYQGTIQSSLPALSFKLFEFVQHISFYVGPIRIVLAPSVRGDFALKLSSEVQISAGVRAPFNGRYSFGYSCTKSGCVELRPFENFFETAPEPGQLLGSISARVIATPSVNIVARVDGFIYVKKLRFFRGDLGVNLAVPAEVWLYAGNTCGDADGDGLNETVNGAIFDLSAELYGYAEFEYFGVDSLRSLALNLPAPWIRKRLPSSLKARDEGTYRRNFFYQDLVSGGSTALSPLIISGPSLPRKASMITLRARPCVPFFGPEVDYVVDFGQDGPQTVKGAPGGVNVAHDWTNIGAQRINAYIARDAFGRDISSPVTSRNVNVEGAACTFVFETVPHGAGITAYKTTGVPFGEVCESEVRRCNNGVLSGSYEKDTCDVRPQEGSCYIFGGLVPPGVTVTAYRAPTVPFGQSCVSEQRTCSNGIFSGSYGYQECTVDPPVSCTWNGATVAHGANVTAYRTSRGLVCEPCESEQRRCNSGVFTGSYAFPSCTQPARRPGQQCD